MSTGMRKWMEKDCPEIEYLSAQVLIDREDLDRLEAAEKERDALRALVDILRSEISTLRAKIEQMERRRSVLNAGSRTFCLMTDMKKGGRRA